MIKIEAGERQYELVEGWGTLPEGWSWGQVAGVACDSQDQVHVYTRTEHPYMVFDRGGTLVHHGGEDSFDLAHSLYIDETDSVFMLSHRGHIIMKFDRNGELVLTLGDLGSERSNAPGKFWGPHCIWVDSQGDLYVGEVLEGQRLQKFARCK